MFRRVIKPILFLPLALSINSINVLSSEAKNYIDNVLEEKSNIIFVDHEIIELLLQELQILYQFQHLASL